MKRMKGYFFFPSRIKKEKHFKEATFDCYTNIRNSLSKDINNNRTRVIKK